jgi:glycolate oxidase
MSVLLSPEADRALALLHRELGSRMITNRELMEEYRRDDSDFEGGEICAVVLAESGKDIATTLKIAKESGVAITPRAGGSGRTGGAVPIFGGIVLSTRGMNSIVAVDREEGFVVVQPGVILEDLHLEVEREGWFYPPDPNSASQCCLAGNVAENAAGPRAFKYGATRDYVLGMNCYLPGGESFYSGRRTKKGVTGYDTTALLVGSEGTLAAFGDIVLRLVPKPDQVMTLLALFSSMKEASDAVTRITSAKLVPRLIEFLDGKTLEIMRQEGSALDERASALLIIEVDGTESECERQAELVGAHCDEAGARSVLVAQSASERNKLWSTRKQMSQAVRRRARYKLSEDVVVPRRHLGALLEYVDRVEGQHRVDALSYGHAGDGNLHVNFLWNDESEKIRVDAAILGLFKKTIELGGTLSGEHGIGLSKAEFLPLEQPPAQIALSRRLKEAFDPTGVMNPGKIFPARGHGNC